MDIDEMKSEMQLKNLYFPSITFTRKAVISSGKLQFKVSRKLRHEEDNFEVQLTVNIEKDDDIALSVTAVGVFCFTQEIQDEDSKTDMAKTNGAAIIFPFIRSQIAGITAQPGMSPIVIPPLNINKLIDD